jgi:hypothetical protein
MNSLHPVTRTETTEIMANHNPSKPVTASRTDHIQKLDPLERRRTQNLTNLQPMRRISAPKLTNESLRLTLGFGNRRSTRLLASPT